ncbi:MAG: hypothetical protein J6Y57_11210 [Lachnospiraceae bacterium]|nr:hypothetical protein [Lachnospiraceae bacterium]
MTNEDILLNPGIPPLSEGQEFAGWYKTDDIEQTLITIEELNKELSTSGIYEGETVSLTARILTTCTVTYLDESEIVLKTVKTYEGKDFAVSENYEPNDPSKVFKGWL